MVRDFFAYAKDLPQQDRYAALGSRQHVKVKQKFQKPAKRAYELHPQSIIHSIVQFTDGSMKAQMGLPDMKLPIQYALAYPDRLPTKWPRFDFTNYSSLTFEQPDLSTFRNLALALEAMDKGGNAPCVLNAANEVAVELFLRDAIGFLEMSELVEDCLAHASFINNPTLADLEASDAEARRLARERVPSAWRS